MRAFGKYRLLEPIASGGMAEVWRAEAPGAAGFVKEVALKLIRGDHDARSDFVEMFIREARLASRLAHGNIVQVFEFDQVDGRYYIAMELVRGRTLRAVVDRCREQGVRFGLARAVHVAAEIARALAYAHRAEHGGLVHRDVSPQNVLVSFEGEVKLADFGIARVLGTSDATSPGTVKGKLAYMAPEQARGGAVDARADVFSLGVILWELCTGRRLFARDSDAAMLAAVIAPEPVAAPSSWNEAVPPELDALVLAALSRDPEARTASAEALASSLAALRLRLAKAPDDIDLRALLLRLWPDGEATATPHEPLETEVKPPRDRDGRSQLDDALPPEQAVRAERAAVATDPEASTRTSLESSRRNRRRSRASLLFAGAVLAVATVAGSRAWSGRHPPSAHGQDLRPSTTPLRGYAQDERNVARESSPPQDPRAASPAASEVPIEPRPSAEPVPRVATPPPPARAAMVRPRPEVRQPARPVPASPPEPAGAVREEMGTVEVRVVPWAYVQIDGADVGETPFEGSLSARSHRLHVRHPTLGEDEVVVTLRRGERYVWRPRLSRP